VKGSGPFPETNTVGNLFKRPAEAGPRSLLPSNIPSGRWCPDSVGVANRLFQPIFEVLSYDPDRSPSPLESTLVKTHGSHINTITSGLWGITLLRRTRIPPTLTNPSLR
jgi:hypothetical protein